MSMTVSIAAPASAHSVTPAALNVAVMVNPAPNRDSGASSAPNPGFASSLLAQQAPVRPSLAPNAAPATTTIPAAISGKTLPAASLILAAADPGPGKMPATASTLTAREKTAKTTDKSAASDTLTGPAILAPPPVQPVPVQTVPAQTVPVQPAPDRETPTIPQADPATAPQPTADDTPAPQMIAQPVATPITTSTTTAALIAAAIAPVVAEQDMSSGPATPSRIAAQATRAAIGAGPLARAAVQSTDAEPAAATPTPDAETTPPAHDSHTAAKPTNAQPLAQHASADRPLATATPVPASPAAPPVPYAAMAPAANAITEPLAPAMPAPAPGPTDFATLVDSIARARDDNARAAAAPVGVTMQHADFGRVSMQFSPRDEGLAVTMHSADPGFAPAAAAAAATSGSAGTGHGQDLAHGNPPDQAARSDTARQSGSSGQNTGQNASQDARQSGAQPRAGNPASPARGSSEAADTADIFA